MKEFEELRQLWQDNRPDIKPDFDAVMKRIETGRKAMASRFGWHIIAFSLGLLLLAYAWFAVSFVTWSSHLAILLVGGCMIYALLYQWKSYRALQSTSALLDEPEKYIAHLKRFQQDRHQFNTRSYRIYASGIALAFIFYSFELYFALPLGIFILLVVFIITWFIITHYVFMRSYIQNEHDKIQIMIDDLERIRKQFND